MKHSFPKRRSSDLISDRDAVVRGVTKEDAFALIDEFSKRYDAESNLSFSAIFLSPDDSKAFGWYGGRNGEKIQNWTMRKWHYCIPPRYNPSHPPRSEEHPSELTSLIRISYAVLC